MKREAINAMEHNAVDRAGDPARLASDNGVDPSVAAALGNCTEPSNVKAGGKACRFRFQCAGCHSLRSDLPSPPTEAYEAP